jgi:ATP-dependent Clp protease ATP-binding subunit ClpX
VEDVGMLMNGPEVAGTKVSRICRNCAGLAVEALDQKMSTANRSSKTNHTKIPAPRDFYNHLNRFVIGQDAAKKRLSVGMANHYKRLLDIDLQNSGRSLIKDADLARTRIEKSNMLIIGPTGVGKTLLARSLADYLGVPFAIGDATTLTEAGYVGEDVENLLLKLLNAADYDMEAAQKGIIYIDEIDKIHRTGHNVSITRDVSGEGVQQSLLKMIEGTVSNIPPQGGRKHPEQQYIQMDTSNILFICGGAFVGLEDIIRHRIGKSNIGFGRKSDHASGSVLQLVEPVDLEQYGMIPELVGRLPVISTLEDLSESDLVRVLNEPENALIKQYRKLFLMDGIDLRFEDEALTIIAQEAKKKGTGARALRTIVEGVMNDIMFSLPESGKGTLVITPDVVKGQKPPRLEVKGEAA